MVLIRLLLLSGMLAPVINQEWHRYINGSMSRCGAFKPHPPVFKPISLDLKLQTPAFKPLPPASLAPTFSTFRACVTKSWMPCRHVYSECNHTAPFPCGLVTLATRDRCPTMLWEIEVCSHCHIDLNCNYSCKYM